MAQLGRFDDRCGGNRRLSQKYKNINQKPY
jgi:hypothetical protein